MDYLYSDETYQIIGAAQEVHRILGPGFLEIIYKDALEIEFKLRKLPYQREHPLEIFYKTIKLNREYQVDFFCFDKIVLEVKAKRKLTEDFYAQTLNYLVASKSRLALLINFGEPTLKLKRIIN